MKIAQFINTTNIGGAETMLARLCVQLVQQGHCVTIFHFGNSFLEKICQQNNISHATVPFENLFRSIFTVHLFSIKFAKLLKEHQIDILHSHLYGSIGGTFLGTYLYKVPHVATLHDVYMVQERTGRGLLLRIIQAMNVQLVSVSKDMTKFYTAYIPCSKNIVNIYNGFQWEDKLANGSYNGVLGVPHRVKIVTVARLIKLKGHEFLISSLCQTLKDNNTQLLIVGNGPEFDRINSHIKQLNLQDHVILLGERHDVHAILLESDIFVLASTSEGLSCSIIEAMSSGLACVVSKVGGNSELIKHGVNGFVFELGEKDKLLNSINMLISDPEKRISMGKQGMQIAKKKFNIEAMVKSYIQLYSDSSSSTNHTNPSNPGLSK